MASNPNLWNLRLVCLQEQADELETAFENEALSVSTFDVAPAGRVAIDMIFDQEPKLKEVEERIKGLSPQVQNPPVSVEITQVGNLDWIKEVAGRFPPLPIARWLVYGAAFREEAKGHPLALQIDASSAFGTGEHPTTRGCLIMLDRLIHKNASCSKWQMLDVGCGSGILAMAFAKATQAAAFGVDMDEDSIEIAKENVSINGLTNHVSFEVGTGYDHPIIAKKAPYDLIMANIFADPLCELAGDLAHHLKKGGHAILSGLLDHQAAAVIHAHEQQGLKLSHRMKLGSWAVLGFTKP